MKTLLQINTSIFSNNGQSSQLAEEFVAAWRARNPAMAVRVRDLGSDPVPHLTADGFKSFSADPAVRTAEQKAAADLSDALIEELKQADVVVIGLPLYNFGVPSALKAYFDHIGRAGVTFRYTANGPVGMLDNKKVYVFATRGGFYEGTALDTQSAYVRDFLAFIGITDVEFIYVEGLGIGANEKLAAIDKAKQTIARLVDAVPASVAA